MPREKKDGKHISYYIDRSVYDRLKEYSESKGQTMTMALERILTSYFDGESKKAKK